MFNSNSFALFLGTAMYAYEGIGMTLPIYNALSLKQQKKFPWTISISLGLIATVYILVGLVPYVYFSGFQHVVMQDIITMDLPLVWWNYLINGLYSLSLVFSYPLMLFPAVNIIEKWLLDLNYLPSLTVLVGKDENRKQIWSRNVVRTGIVFITLLVAIVGSEQINNFVSLIGCFACTPLAFIYPCLFHMYIIPRTWKNFLINSMIILFGVAVTIWSTYQAIATWSINIIQPCIGPSNWVSRLLNVVKGFIDS